MRDFRRRIGIVAVALMLISTMGATTAAQESTDATAGETVFSADGIETAVLAQADLADAGAGSTLLLEMLDVAPDAELPTHQTTSPELFYVLAGVLTFQDNFGFASVVDAGRVVSLNPGTEYTIANAESEAGRLLRLRLAGGAAATPGATPVAGDGGGDGTTMLMQAPLDGIELDGARMYLGRAQFGANVDSGEQGHAGPLGIYVDSGTLNVVSPSGLVGAIEAGRTVSLPAETPLHASTGETEAVVFLAGIAGADGDPFGRIRSEDDVTEPGAVLEGGATWRSDTAEFTVTSHPYSQVMGFDFSYANTGDAETTLTVDGSNVSVVDDAGREWHFLRSDCPEGEIVAPQSIVACSAHFNPGSGVPRGPVQLTIQFGQFGEIQNATWQMEIVW